MTSNPHVLNPLVLAGILLKVFSCRIINLGAAKQKILGSFWLPKVPGPLLN